MILLTRAERRAAFAKALQTQTSDPLASWDPSAGNIIRAALDVVVGDELANHDDDAHRIRIAFLMLAKAIEGND